MKKYLIIAISGMLVFSLAGCKKYLNINSDPDTTQEPLNSSVFPAVLSGMPYGIQRDARYISKYIQNWHASANGNNDTYDRHGYTFVDNNMGDIWWMMYYAMGKNMDYMIANGIKLDQPEYVGATQALKAWAFLTTTDNHGEIIFDEAWKVGVYAFKYDSQYHVYQGIDSICREAIRYLNIAKERSLNTLGAGDYVYNGNLDRWKKFAYGIRARVWHRFTNKTGLYNADSVMRFVDSSFVEPADDFLVGFDATKNNNSNFWGTFRNNLSSFRQSNFIVRLLDGTILSGSNAGPNRDPRLSHMLTASQDTTNGNGGYRGVDPAIGDPYSALTGTYAVGSTNWVNARKRVAAPWGDSIYGNPSASAFAANAGKYLFKDKVVMPVMTYAELQFVKAEAALRKGETGKAYDAYLAGINGHFDFINRSYSANRASPNIFHNAAITTNARTAYLNGPNVKKNGGELTMSDIMLQKYIATWGWGFIETWVDLRRFHYTDLDNITNTNDQVYKGFTLPTSYFANNEGNPAYRVRPNYRSEYTYNREQLEQLGADKPAYHTIQTWFSRFE